MMFDGSGIFVKEVEGKEIGVYYKYDPSLVLAAPCAVYVG